MGLVTSSWDRPIQGVSQQPPKVRLPGQATLQENAVSSVVNGLIKRPGTRRIAGLSQAYPANTAYYYYNRGSGERYFVVIPPNELPEVYDIEGDRLVVENELSWEGYIRDSNPENNHRLTTISDFTFISNRTEIPKASNTQTSSEDSTAIINLQFADYGRTYSISVDGNVVVSYQTPDGSQAAHINYVDTTQIAAFLYSGTVGANPDAGTLTGDGLNNLTGYTATRRGNVITLTKNDGADFTISSRDGADGRDLFVIKGEVKEVSDLPLYAPTGYLVQVVGTGSDNSDAYWLRAEAVSGSSVRWVESAGPSQSVGLDPTTMPHVLIRDRFESGKAVFKLATAPWEGRSTGDDTSNPMPSFVQDSVPITSVGTFQNRLLFTAGESVVMSRSNFFFDFFRSTVRTSLEDEPIDIFADTNQVNFLENYAILDGDIVFFSQNGQFLQSGQEAITKDNATLQYASTFENTSTCQPVASGDVIFFAFEYGRFSGVREFYTDSFTDTKRARPVTEHVDEYILGKAKQMASSTNRNQLLVRADKADELFVYNWLWQGQERAQSSWSKWIFDGSVRFVTYDNDVLYLLIERYGNLDLEVIELGDQDTGGLTFPVRLDRRDAVTATRTTEGWDIPEPYWTDEDAPVVIVRGPGCSDPGVTVSFSKDGGVFKTEESLAPSGTDTVTVYFGVSYKMRYKPTMPFIKDRNGRVMDTDRLTINDVSINYDLTGLTFVKVQNDWGVSREYSFNGRQVGGINNIVGFAPLVPGQFNFPVRQVSDKADFTIETDSHLPFQLRDMEWRGRFKQRGRRV